MKMIRRVNTVKNHSVHGRNQSVHGTASFSEPMSKHSVWIDALLEYELNEFRRPDRRQYLYTWPSVYAWQWSQMGNVFYSSMQGR